MTTEDDTFRVLRRQPFSTLVAQMELIDIDLPYEEFDMLFYKTLEDAGWTPEEYSIAARKHYT